MHQLLYSDASLAFPPFPFFFMEKKKEKAEKCNFLYIVALFFFLLSFNRRRRPLVVADRKVPIEIISTYEVVGLYGAGLRERRKNISGAVSRLGLLRGRGDQR